jgi:hypothetical protein
MRPLMTMELVFSPVGAGAVLNSAGESGMTASRNGDFLKFHDDGDGGIGLTFEEMICWGCFLVVVFPLWGV